MGPNHVNVEAGEVSYDNAALEISIQMNTPSPDWWVWDIGATGLGNISGEQANAYLDWVSVPDFYEDGSLRPEMSRARDADNNFGSEAGQYNLISARSSTPPYGQDNAPLIYIPDTTCGSLIEASMKWFSSELGVRLAPTAEQKWCKYRKGC